VWRHLDRASRMTFQFCVVEVGQVVQVVRVSK